MKQNRHSFFPPILALLLTMLCAAALVIVIGWQLGELDFRLPGAGRPAGQVQVHSQPAGAQVYIDDRLRGNTPYQIELKMGDHWLRVELEGYLPYEASFQVEPGQATRLEARLLALPVAERVAEGAAYPGWMGDGSLVYFKIDTGEFRSYPSGTVVAGPFDGIQLGITYAPEGGWATLNLLRGYDPELLLVNLSDRGEAPLGLGDCPVTWPDAQDLATLCFGANGEPLGLWQGPAGATLRAGPTADFASALPADWMGISAGGNLLALLSGSRLSLWQAEGDRYGLIKAIEGVSAAAWNPAAKSELVYIDQGGALNLLTVNSDWKMSRLAEAAEPPLAWLSDGDLLFTLYNEQDGGTALWALDVESGSRRLILDAGVMRGRAQRLTVAPDGKRIAYATDFDILFQIDLEP